jgi:hypothetical protein
VSRLNSSSFSVSIPNSDFLNYNFMPQYVYLGIDSYLYLYDSPVSNINTKIKSKYRANRKFGDYTERIKEITALNETSWKLQGFAWMRISSATSSSVTSSDALGWTFNYNDNEYFWYDSNSNTKYPAVRLSNGLTSSLLYRSNNYIARYINYNNYNLYLDYNKQGGETNDGIRIYTSTSLPSSDPNVNSLPLDSVLIASVTQSTSPIVFYSLKGNQYLYIVSSRTLPLLSN